MTKCIDISTWQGKIDFKKLSKTDIKSIIIKCGGSDDSYYKDDRFVRNYNEAKKYGFYIGVYYFAGSDFITESEGKICAKKCYEIIKDCELDYPVYIDIETTSPNHYYGTTDAILSFCAYLEKRGFKTGVYASALSGFNYRFDYEKIKEKSIWVAEWDDERGDFPPKCDIWQYTSTGKANGIDGFVDMDICYIDIDKKISENKKIKTKLSNVQSIYNLRYKELAYKVLKGEYGNGSERKNKLIKQGYDYKYVQALVNAILSEKN